MSTITERVAAGAAFLDEHDPQWWRADVERAIDLDTLLLSSPSTCVLGQRCPVETLERWVLARYSEALTDIYDAQDYNFWALAHELSAIPPGEAGDSNSEVVTWSSELGFNSATGDEYDALTVEWIRVITERRSSS